MNELLGPQSWGDYFCEKSIEVCSKVYGDSESSYYDALKFIKTHPDVPKDERVFWLTTVKMLQTNPIAIKYNNRYERLEEYRFIGIGYEEDFTDATSAKNALKSAQDDYYSTDFDSKYFSFSQIVETSEGDTIKPLPNLDQLEQNAKIKVYSIKGKSSVVMKDKLKEYLDQEIKLAKEEDSNLWYINQKIKDIDDGFTVFDKII